MDFLEFLAEDILILTFERESHKPPEVYQKRDQKCLVVCKSRFERFIDILKAINKSYKNHAHTTIYLLKFSSYMNLKIQVVKFPKNPVIFCI